MATKIVTVSELKANLASVMAQLAADATPIYVTQHGKPHAVLMNYEEYEALREKLEERDRPRLVQTIRGIGYALREEAREE